MQTFSVQRSACCEKGARRFARSTQHAARGTQRGFTLLEVMVALAILAGVVLTVITSFNYHLGVVGRDREESEAVLLARSKLEEPGLFKQEKKDGTFAPERPDVTWRLVTTPTELPGVARHSLTVTWNAGQRSLTLVQYAQK